MSAVAPWVAVPAVGGALVAGVYATGVLDALAGRRRAGRPLAVGDALSLPWRRACLLLVQRGVSTERPDASAWMLAPALYGAMAAAALTVVPLSEGRVVADLRTGIVVWGAAEMLAMVGVYLHGWSPNSAFPLLGAYRFVAQAVSFELLSMFVLIAAALPARSLQVTRIVESQESLWNVLRQPLGLPLFVVVTLGVAFWGPLNLPDGDDLAGGTGAELSGPARLAWEGSRAAWLVAASAMGAAAFLGGWLGPWLPGPLWMVLKTLALLTVTVWLGHRAARVRPERFVVSAWTVLLPLAFLDLVVAGVQALP
ncbi:MAG TPA: NADH-quinone oxidoreductase subunit H [Egibacteraceae bacterium]|nr:NADH-quinone oxidoreductase subunit H [Egibacteraceae bacterium]